MVPTRARALLAVVGCAAAILTACERSATAPLAARASVAPSVLDAAAAQEPGATSGLVDLQGGVLDLNASPAYPLQSTLFVPAGVLDGPAYFDVAREVSGDALLLRVSGRPAAELAPMSPTQNFTEEPIVLSLRNAGSEARDITVVFTPPDGADPVVVKASLRAGQAMTLGFRRGRSKYSVIYF